MSECETVKLYKDRILAGRRMNDLINEGFSATIDEVIKDLAYEIKIVGDDKVISIGWNIPHYMEMQVGNYYFGSNYVKTDTEWCDLADFMPRIIRALSEKGAVEYIAVKKSCEIELKLKLKLDTQDSEMALVNPNRAFVLPWTKRISRKIPPLHIAK